MAAILNFKMAANLQHSQEVTLDFLFDFDVTYNVSKGISSTISGSMFAPSNHTIAPKVPQNQIIDFFRIFLIFLSEIKCYPDLQIHFL